jgi:hypothetical protein
MSDAPSRRLIGPSFTAAVILSSCLAPPPECPPGTARAEPAPEAAAAASAPAAPSEPVKSGDKVVIWDGDEHGGTAKGWQDCDKKADGCKATLTPAASIGRDGSVGLRFHGEGPGWIGGGWNWQGWWPADAGTDISGYKSLVFWFRIEAANKDEAPDPNSINVSLKCSSNKEKGQSKSIPTAKFVDGDVLDGQWHQVTVPIDALMNGAFDPKTAWEFVFGTWSGSPRKFDIIFDDIQFVAG